jgi:Asp/Glu/hydantoin racemase
MNMRSPPSQRVTRILVINPNSSEDMTAGVAKAIKELQLEHVIQHHPY